MAALMAADMVFVRRGGAAKPLEPPYLGPFWVVSRGSKIFQLEIGGRMEVVSVDRLKPYEGATAVSPAAAPRRGRPPKNSVASSDQQGGLEARGGTVEARENPGERERKSM